MPKSRLLLVGWDSADWGIIRPLAAEGKMAACSRLIEAGVTGNLTTLEPQLSPMLWTSIATGKHAYHHGVPGFTEVNGRGQVVPVSAATRRCKTLWEILGERGLKSHVVSWFATQGEQLPNGGCMVSNLHNSFAHRQEDMPEDWPAPPAGTYHPPELADYLKTLRVSPWDIDGNEVMRLFVPGAPKIDQQKDRRLWILALRLAEAFSAHAASVWLMENRPDWDFMAIYYRALDEICHDFMLYYPPQMAGTTDEDFGLYREVVAGAYRMHDQMMTRLLNLAGSDTAVILVSDHGFHHDHLRPKFTPRVPAGITVWHRPQGIIAAMGPGFRTNEKIYGARLLDVAPTILTYFGLPVGADMEGRVLTEAFAKMPNLSTIPSWEDEKTNAPQATSLSDADYQAVLAQFVALGYINEISEDAGQAAAETSRENSWNLARACMDAGRYDQALPLLEEIHHSIPERIDWAQTLSRCQMRLGLLDEANATAAATLAGFDAARSTAAHLLQASIAIERKDAIAALKHLSIVGEQQPHDLQVLCLRMEALLKLHRWEECQTVCDLVLAEDPNNAQAHLGHARCALHLGNAEAAVSHALEAIGFQYGNPRGHFLLGIALYTLEQHTAAEDALETTVRLSPRFGAAFRYLAHTRKALGKLTESAFALQQSRLCQFLDQAKDDKRLAVLRAQSKERVPGIIARREQTREQAAAQSAARAASSLPPDQEFVLVSGLPRSGTSLMMQMLKAGGMELMTDGQRAADEDNPAGYWEWEDIKKLPQQPLIIEQAQGKVVKVISALLTHLSPKHRYKIIFMTRPIGEIVTSQWKMLEHRGAKPVSQRNHLETTQASHAQDILNVLRRHPRVSLLEINYPDLVNDPSASVIRIAEFCGASLLDQEMMTSAVRPELYRNKTNAMAGQLHASGIRQ